MKKNNEIIGLKGIGTKIQSLFHKLNIYSLDDLIRHFPRAYIRMGEAKTGISGNPSEVLSVLAKVKRVELLRTRGGKSVFHAYVSDDNGKILICSWFNMPYLKNTLKVEESYVFYGRLEVRSDRLYMIQPKFFDPCKYEGLNKELQPVYSLTAGINNNLAVSAIRSALSLLDIDKEYFEYLPKTVLDKYELMPRPFAIKKIHFPTDEAELKSARDRMVFDEFFVFLLKLLGMKEDNKKEKNIRLMPDRKVADRMISVLPFRLTGVQLKTINDIYGDLNSKSPMNRLIQGDVGSGKTIVAILAMIIAYENGFQSAFMAPTEVLAVQHFKSVESLIQDTGIEARAILLTGSMTARQKKDAYEKIRDHKAEFIIGTHALIRDKVKFSDLGLVITDEQHRFGVRQRESLSNKSKAVHTLIMSATPIPRTLAIMLYGDLDISVMDELPADRLPIKNAVLNEGHRVAAEAFLLEQIRTGRQCYIVCPMIEVNEELDLQNVEEYSEGLKKRMPKDIRISMLHGSMSAADKSSIMDEFQQGRIDILVSTTVIEVGVNVPNATVMLIEDADRFGLAQLHQLRGRVGRGKEQSYAMFMSKSRSETALKRLEVLKHSNDGFFIAEQDLKLRGPGELFGVKQSGALSFRLADIYSDADWLSRAVKEINLLAKQDNLMLRKLVDHFKTEDVNT